MGLGIVSDSDFVKELSNCGISKNPRESNSNERSESIEKKVEILDNPDKGRGKGNVEVPNSLRRLIGDTSISEGRGSAIELGKSFGISPSSTSAYSNGSTSTSSYDKTPNSDAITNARQRISKKARNRLVMALNAITEDKLNFTKARDLAGIAKDMSAVVNNMETDSSKQPNKPTGPTFVFYNPGFKTEDNYEVIVAKE